MIDKRIAAAVGAIASIGALTVGGMDVEVVSALLAVLWRAEDVAPTPEWLPWVVYAGLIMVAAYQMTKWAASLRS